MKCKHTKEIYLEIAKDSFSIADMCRKLGIEPKGGNYSQVKKYIEEFNIDTSHFTGQAWNKGMGGSEEIARVKMDDILKKETNFKAAQLKKRLFETRFKGEKM